MAEDGVGAGWGGQGVVWWREAVARSAAEVVAKGVLSRGGSWQEVTRLSYVYRSEMVSGQHSELHLVIVWDSLCLRPR